uniref:DENN domain-containing protein 1C-like n=1 Tax=Pristiophorus japonicus TaxID=55135 RepID=UPI00398E327A
MGSRIKERPERTFELFIEASCPKSADIDPTVLSQFPEDYNDQESLQSLPKFCFPFDVESAPMPYLIGIHSSLMERVRSKALEDVIILNVDSNTLESPFNDLEKLPPDVVSILKMKLKKQSAVTGDMVARAFLRTQAAIFGSYQDALKFNTDLPVTFCEETFLNQKPSSKKTFLQHAVHLQLFKQFIDDRLEKLNEGKGLTDVFEEEVNLGGHSSGCSKSYQLWMQNFKKGGGALIHTVRAKTNPAMKNMYKYAKGQAKLGLKGMKNRLRHKDLGEERGFHRGGSLRCEPVGGPTYQRRVQSECLQNRLPITQHFGQSRPRRPARRYMNPDGSLPAGTIRSTSGEEGLDSSLDTVDDELLGCSLLQDEDMDLLGEIFDTLSTQTALDKGLLYGTRSLDFFNLDSMEDIRRIRDINPSEESLNCNSRRESEPIPPRLWGFDGSAERVRSLSASLEETSGLSSVSNSQPDLGDSGSLSSNSHDENVASPEAESLKHNAPSDSNTEDLGAMEESSVISPSGKANEKCTGIHWDRGSLLAQPNGILAENGDSQLEVGKVRSEAPNEGSSCHNAPLQANGLKLSTDELKTHKGQDVEADEVRSPVTCVESRADLGCNTENSPPPTAPKTSSIGLRARLPAQACDGEGADGGDMKGESSSGQEMGPTEQASSTEDSPPAPASEEATTPSVLSALSYFQARAGEQKADIVKEKVRLLPSAAGALARYGKTECREEQDKADKTLASTTSHTPPGRSPVGEMAVPQAEELKPESAILTSDTDPDITPPRKVSELKKRFES